MLITFNKFNGTFPYADEKPFIFTAPKIPAGKGWSVVSNGEILAAVMNSSPGANHTAVLQVMREDGGLFLFNQLDIGGPMGEWISFEVCGSNASEKFADSNGQGSYRSDDNFWVYRQFKENWTPIDTLTITLDSPPEFSNAYRVKNLDVQPVIAPPSNLRTGAIGG